MTRETICSTTMRGVGCSSPSCRLGQTEHQHKRPAPGLADGDRPQMRLDLPQPQAALACAGRRCQEPHATLEQRVTNLQT